MACGLQDLEHKVGASLPGCRRSPITVSSSCDAFDYTPVRSSPPFGKQFLGFFGEGFILQEAAG
jgi:hypothetical protein